jgi:hypothetical protein
LSEDSGEPGVIALRNMNRQSQPLGGSGAGVEMDENIAQGHGFLV